MGQSVNKFTNCGHYSSNAERVLSGATKLHGRFLLDSAIENREPRSGSAAHELFKKLIRSDAVEPRQRRNAASFANIGESAIGLDGENTNGAAMRV